MWPQIIAMIAAAALSAHSQSQAAKRQQEQAMLSQQRQMTARNQATDEVVKRVEEFDPANRKQQQDEIGQQLTGEYDRQVAAPAITAQGVQIGTTINGGSSSTDYLTTKAREQAKAIESLRGLAALMGRTGSASELRRKEAVGIGDTAGAIGRIQNGANNIAGIDQIGIQAAGQPNLGATLASAALGAYGTQGLMTAGMGASAGSGLTTGDFARMDRAGAWLK